jgi:hypothetical protein
MIKSKNEIEDRGIEIDLTGPEGNAFYLLGKANNLAKDLGKDPKQITDEMQSADYDYLIEVFEREFGEYVTLYK